MDYEGFDFDNGEESLLLPADHSQKVALTVGGVRVFRVTASSWEEAKKAWHQFKGWAPPNDSGEET